MFLKARKFLAYVVIALILAIFFAGFALAEKKKKITIKIQYGEKAKTERNYNILAKPEVVILEGETATVKVENKKGEFGFKAELTPTIGKNPELIIVKMKAWELRNVEEGDKIVKKYVELADRVIRVKRGFPSVNEVLDAGPNRNVLIMVTPNY